MVFSTVIFLLLFLPLAFAGAWLAGTLSRKLSNAVLLGASLVFYFWGEKWGVGWLVASVVFNWLAALAIQKVRGKSRPWDKAIVAVAIVANLAFLGYFKYASWLFGLNVALPLGISFYTFQAMSYVIDVYRRDTSATPSVLDFACYVTMFPQLVAGPIVRYTDIAQQLIERRPRLAAGMERFLEGLVKKVLIANTVGEFNDSIWNVIHGGGGIAPSMAFLALVAYTIQIYYDFSGYSDMAIGIGRMLGFEFPENFLHPYSSRSIREFWRRWHISLSTWFRDYLYIPLGGNRKGVPRTFLNNLIVFALCGLWHGAGIMFLLWGLWHGAFLIFERIFLRGKSTKPSSRVVSLLTSLGAHVYALAVIMFGWLLFRSETLADCGLFLRSLFGVVAESQAARGIWLDCSLKFSLAIIFGTIFAFPVWPAFEKLRARHAIFDLLHWILLTVLAIVAIFLLAGGAYNPFLYFRF